MSLVDQGPREIEPEMALAAPDASRIKERHAALRRLRYCRLLVVEDIAVKRGAAGDQGALKSRNGLDDVGHGQRNRLVWKRRGECLPKLKILGNRSDRRFPAALQSHLHRMLVEQRLPHLRLERTPIPIPPR